MSSAQNIIGKIVATIEEIKMLPAPPTPTPSMPTITTTEHTSPPQHRKSNDNKQGRSHQSTGVSRIDRPVRAAAPGWSTFFEDIKKSDEAVYKERQARAAAFAASGEKDIIMETYKETKT